MVLTAEPNNLMSVNSYKYSGLANSKAVGIEFDEDVKGRPCASMSLKVPLPEPRVFLLRRRRFATKHALH